MYEPLSNVIKPPADMPVVQVAMLQATIRVAWREYEGDQGDPEEFWNFLTGTTK
jgi:hypothetical protein